MNIIKTDFGTLPNGNISSKYTLTNNNGMLVEISDVAAAIASIKFPDRLGTISDVVLGYDTPEKYLSKGAYHGAIVGRVANRIEDAVFTLNNKEYRLEPNHQGRHLLHGGLIGLDSKQYNVKMIDSRSIALSCVMRDGEDGFPGEIALTVTYTLTEDNGLIIHYLASSDEDTVFNPLSHVYFNLGGHDSGSILNQTLQINAKKYTPIDSNCMVYGESLPVSGAVDFQKPKAIGRDINAECDQLILSGGYDCNYFLDTADKKTVLAATATDPKSGRKLDVYTNSPCILFYSGNHLSSHRVPGKDGIHYRDREGFCLETGYPPNALKYPSLPQPILRRGEVFDYMTEYRFGLSR